ncbi:MAG: 30S ribosomal protein S4 [Anaerolineaceae bacterium]|nr:30S ribosomal protein S4 [Anaerolineaceae bacterium]MCY3934607.1 30S ribosomal protein S4 [Chloroflexota bacterium]
MASYHGPKAKKQRRFGELLIPRPKYQRILEKRAYPPGEHGKEKQYRSGRRSDYGIQLDEKQKLAFVYNVRERQLRRYYKQADRMAGATGDNLISLLERRLDNLVYRAGFAATVWAARQIVGHRHVLIDGKRVDLPSYLVNPGEVISLTAKMRNNVHVQQWMEQVASSNLPYLQVDRDAHSATLLMTPERLQIPVPVDVQLVVEYYNRLT